MTLTDRHERHASTNTTILNLGCGVKTSSADGVVNVDWSIYLRLRRNPLMRRFTPFLLRGERRARFISLPNNIVVHDLSRGIPFEDSSVDVVYHSHFLEHLDRAHVNGFLLEARRVLRPGGVHRIVVPDFEALARSYLDHIALCEREEGARTTHDCRVSELLEQFVRVEAFGSSQQGRLRRAIENKLLGDARKRGEVHRWAYDRYNLTNLLRRSGYIDIRMHAYKTSRIQGWNAYGLDLSDEGTEYRPGSLYMEASAPSTERTQSEEGPRFA
ncbi:MAG: class I SAM-dependent methyltransferase [bacterium]